ncbi:MAG TPA: hypothetical protein VF230_10920 [Acidimicrobiales bacterium]
MTTADLAARLPSIATLREWCLSLAVLDAILVPEWEWRSFSFDADWAPSQEMASMRNGSGDEYSITFTPAGAYVRGFDHESPLSPWAFRPVAVVRGLIDRVPASLRECAVEPAFTMDGIPQVTGCLWREGSDNARQFGSPARPELAGEDGGAATLFAELDGKPETYVAFAAEVNEVELDLDQVRAVFERRPICAAFVARLNPAADAGDVLAELRSMGYPTDLGR